MEKKVFTLDRFTRCILMAIAVLLAVIVFELWAERPSSLPAAVAQIPDTGMQRQQIVSESRRTNALLGEILDHLRTKPIKVQVAATDKQVRFGRGRGAAAQRETTAAPRGP